MKRRFGSRSDRAVSPASAPAQSRTGVSRAAVDALVDVAAIEQNLVRRTDGWYAGLIEVEGEAFAMLTPDEQDFRIEAYGRVLTHLQDGWKIQVTRLVEPTNLAPLIEYFHTVQQNHPANTDPVGVIGAEYADGLERLQHTILSHVTLLTVWDKTASLCQDRVNAVLSSLQDNQFVGRQCDNERIGVLLQVGYGHSPVHVNSAIGGWMHDVVMHQALLEADAQTPPKTSQTPPAQKPPKMRKGSKTPARTADAAVSGLSLERAQAPILAPHMASLRDVLEPAAALEEPGRLDLGGVYAATLVARTWPEQAHNGWLEWLYTFDDPGVRRRVSFHIESLATSRVMADLRRRQIQLDAETHWARKRGRREEFDVELGAESIELLRQEIGRGRQRMFLVTLFVTLMADSAEHLRDATQHLIQKAAGYAVVLRPLYLEETLGFRTTLPLGVQPLRGAPDRGVPTIALATTFPFSAGELQDPVGDVWGDNLST
ncbi:MAG: hypothetical protein ACYCT0_10235, partial [Sulfobacillus sp.]